MYVSHLLLGLVATVSAIDIYGYTSNEKCGSGAHAVCVNANPGSCCVSASGDIFRSIGFRAIPTNWNIIGQAYNGGGCKNVKFTAQSQGSQNVCCGGSWYSGGNYKFTSSKRFQGADESCPANQGCASVHRADLMMFEDGSKYNITGLDDILYTEMPLEETTSQVSTLSGCRVTDLPIAHSITVFGNAENSSDIPAKFDEYKFE